MFRDGFCVRLVKAGVFRSDTSRPARVEEMFIISATNISKQSMGTEVCLCEASLICRFSALTLVLQGSALHSFHFQGRR